ncbi:hypothetical protein DFH09DRAFT_1173057 [Mycena vulgaris]|nr:hypothetical protein DFH09DRAFT_1173057 [Mycena vulgaris]
MAESIDPAFQHPAPVEDASEAGQSSPADKNVESAAMGKGIRMTAGSKKETSRYPLYLPFPPHPPALPTPAAKPIQHMLFGDLPGLVLPQSSRGARASSSAPAVVVEVEKEVVLEAKEEEPVREVPAPVVAQTMPPGGVLRRISDLFSSWIYEYLLDVESRIVLPCIFNPPLTRCSIFISIYIKARSSSNAPTVDLFSVWSVSPSSSPCRG